MNEKDLKSLENAKKIFDHLSDFEVGTFKGLLLRNLKRLRKILAVF